MSARLGWLEKLAMLVPGYRGYKKRELLREDDKILRSYVADQLREASKNLQQAASELVSRLGPQAQAWLQQPGNPIQLLNEYSRRLYNIASLVEHLELGYSPSFNVLKVKEEELRRLKEIDNSLVGFASAILETSKIILQQVRSQGWFDTRYLATLAESITSIEEVVEKRRRFIHGSEVVGTGVPV